MLVKDWMRKNVITLDVSDSLQHAINVVMENRVSLLLSWKRASLSEL